MNRKAALNQILNALSIRPSRDGNPNVVALKYGLPHEIVAAFLGELGVKPLQFLDGSVNRICLVPKADLDAALEREGFKGHVETPAERARRHEIESRPVFDVVGVPVRASSKLALLPLGRGNVFRDGVN